MIPEPQRTYLLELLTTLGETAGGFVLAGAQAMKFVLPRARATRDFDFVLDASGCLPDGAAASVNLRVTRPHSLVMMKLMAMDDRYRNVRGSIHSEHDRNEARIHASDIIAIVGAQSDLRAFRTTFDAQFEFHPDLGETVSGIVREYFGHDTAPGLLLYEEALMAGASNNTGDPRTELASELHRARRMLASFIAPADLT